MRSFILSLTSLVVVRRGDHTPDITTDSQLSQTDDDSRGLLHTVTVTDGANSRMIMDGLDTLSQVALANQLSIGFDTYSPLPQLAACMAGTARTPDMTADDNLNTPVTASSDVNFSFLNSDIDVSQEALPISGEYMTPDLHYCVNCRS